MHHEEHVGKPRAKVDAIDVVVTGGLGSVHITALGAVELHHRFTRYIRETYIDREEGWGETERGREGRGEREVLHGADMVSLEGHTYRKNSLILTENTRAVAEVTTLVFFNL